MSYARSHYGLNSLADIQAGQTLYYSVNFTPSTVAGTNVSQPWYSWLFNPAAAAATTTWISTDWTAVAQRILGAVLRYGQGNVVSASAGNITLNFRSSMNRGSMDDLRGDIDRVVAAQPEVSSVNGSMIRLEQANTPTNNPIGGTPGASSGSGGGGGQEPDQPQTDPLAQIAAQLGLTTNQLLLIGGGLALFLFLKR